MTTKNPLDSLLKIRDGDNTARWNFQDAVNTPVSSPGGIGNAAAVTYSFLTTIPGYYSSTITGFAQFSDLQKQAVRDVLTSIADVVHLSFSEVPGIGEMTFAMNANTGSSGYAYFPGFNSSYVGETIKSVNALDFAGDAWFNSTIAWTADDFTVGGSGYGTLIHEIGHALGLKHPFETARSGGYILDSSLENTQYTVMSYTQHPFSFYRSVNETSPGHYSTHYEHIQPETLMPLDIEALQYLYGANTSFHTGNDTYTFDTSRPFIKTLWDGGGNDTISVANFSLGCVIDLRDGYFSSIRIPSDPLPPGQIESNSGIYDGTDNLGIANGTLIENAIGSNGDDQLIGNAAVNALDGRGGADTLSGGDGNDTFNGGDGNDMMNGGFGFDTVRESGVLTNYAISQSGNSVVLTNNLTGERDVLTDIERVTFDSGNNLTIAYTEAEAVARHLMTNWLHRDLSPDEGAYVLKYLTVNSAADIANVFLTLPEASGLANKSATELLAGYESHPLMQRLSAAREVKGGDGNDQHAVAFGVSVNIDSGHGHDIVAINEALANMSVDVNGSTLELSRHADGAMLDLKNVEMLALANGDTLAIGHDPIEGILGRLVHTFFDRNASIEEWQLGRDVLAQHIAPDAILNWFQDHAGLTQLSDSDYIQTLFQNTFNRAATVSEQNGYLTQLHNGSLDRSWLAVDLAQTQEAITIIGSQVVVMEGW